VAICTDLVEIPVVHTNHSPGWKTGAFFLEAAVPIRLRLRYQETDKRTKLLLVPVRMDWYECHEPLHYLYLEY
jgi:hypothetical protein